MRQLRIGYRTLQYFIIGVGMLFSPSVIAQQQGPTNFMIVVTADQATISEGEYAAPVPKGTELFALWTNPENTQAWVKVPGQERFGWISVSHAQRKQMPAQWQQLVDQAVAVTKKIPAKEEMGTTTGVDVLRVELERILAAMEPLANGHPVIATLRLHLLRTYQKSQGDRAAMQARKAIVGFQPHYGVTSAPFMRNVNTVVKELNRVRQEEAAREILEDILQLDERPLRDRALRMMRIVIALQTQQDDIARMNGRESQKESYLRTVEFLRNVRRLAIERFGDDDFLAQKWTNSLCVSLIGGEQHEEAETLLQGVIENLSSNTSNPDYQQLLQLAIGNLAVVYDRTSRDDKATALYRDVLKRLENPNHEIIVRGNLCRLLEEMDAPFAAEEECRKWIKTIRETHGNQSVELARALTDLGRLYAKLQLPSNAEVALRESCEIFRQIYGEHDLAYIRTLVQVAATQGQRAAHRKRLQTLKRVRKLTQERFGENLDAAQLSVEPMIGALISNGEIDEAAEVASNLLASYRRHYGDDHPRTKSTAYSLALIYTKLSRHKKAIPLAEEVLKYCLASLETEQRPVYRSAIARTMGQAQNVLALCLAPDDAIRASAMGKRGVATYVKWMNEMGQSRAMLNYGLLLLSAGNVDEGVEELHRSRVLAVAAFRKAVSTIPHESVQPFLESNGFRDDIMVALSSVYHLPEPDLVRRSAEWLINSKGLAQAALAEAGLVELPDNAPALQELRDTRSQLAKLASDIPDDVKWKKFHDRRVAQLKQQEVELTNEINRTRARLDRHTEWLPLEVLQSHIPQDAALINISRVRVNQFLVSRDKYAWDDARYLAWVIPSQASHEDVRLVDLGPAAPIDDLVQRVRHAIVKSTEFIDREGEGAMVAAFHQVASKLSDRLLGPLRSVIAEHPQLIISPDAALWTVPWELLPLDEKRYLIETSAIRYLVSGRELVPQADASYLTTAPVLFADPDYDGARETHTAPSTSSPLRGLSRIWSANSRFARLEGTAVEARIVAPLLKEYVGTQPNVTLGSKANETLFKRLKHPQAVVVSTHGYFLPEDPSSDVRVDPLLRCGLAMAGCNQRSIEDESMDDGLLTGIEIVGTDLRGTELVVLSACETGLGDIQAGEGVAGLRLAFQLAGAKTVVSSLWKVSDRETTQLMKRFFENLTKGHTKSHALRAAQLQIIRSRRERNGAAHPFYWAAFTTTGSE